MKEKKMKKFFMITLVVAIIGIGICGFMPKDKENKIPCALEKLPGWVDKYASSNTGDMRFLRYQNFVRSIK